MISHDHIEIIVNAAGDLLFFRQREGPWMPTLRLLHKCKQYLPTINRTKQSLINRKLISNKILLYFTIYFASTQNLNILDPFFLPMEQVDKGAIRFVLSGANIMCPGLTSKGAKMTPVEKGTVVVSFVEITRMSLFTNFQN